MKGWPHGGANTLAIAAVERDTGLSKDTLRAWERRYGFPVPARDDEGERAYTPADVQKLRLVKRLLDAGHRPGRIVPLSLPELTQLAEQAVLPPMETGPAVMNADNAAAHLALIRSHDVAALRGALTRQWLGEGLEHFVIDVLGPLNAVVGEAWMRGQLEIFEEHLYTESVQAVLRQALAATPAPATAGQPRVLLTTFAGEQHGLGLLMAEALLTLQGCHCVSLGAQTPLWDIVLAAAGCRSDIVALSFTACLSPNQVINGLTELRLKLPASVQVWAGGSAPVLHRRPLPGVMPMASLQELPAAVQRWRAGL